ncbi:MAG: molybdopterin cofactor-binding domain-containing protein [Lautropia sp.]
MSAPPDGRRLRTRAELHSARGVLLVTRDPPPAPPPAPGQPPVVAADPADGIEVLLAVCDDGSVIALNGHVDLGTGIRTALAQMVAEELDVDPAAIDMRLGDTALVPNQGPTIASASIQLHSMPLRQAAAQARAALLALAEPVLGAPAAALVVADGVVSRGAEGTAATTSYAELLHGRRIVLALDPATPLKPVGEHRVVGRSLPRVDIPAKVRGELVFVHDLRLPGMLHGRVVRPPYAGADHGDFIGNTLESVDERAIADVPGLRAVVAIRDFVGVVAEREEHAEQAAAELPVRWKDFPRMPPLGDLAQALRANPSTPRRLVDEGDVDAVLGAGRDAAPDDAGAILDRQYVWPYQMHASIGPSCAVAQWHGADARPALTVWSGTQNPFALRADLALLLQLEPAAVEVVRMEAAGCYGRNGADDVTADAALLSRAVGAPVRVQLSRAQENLWDPKGAAQAMQVRGAVDAAGTITAWDFTSSYPSNAAPTLALLLTRTIEPIARSYAMGDRTARPPYDVPNLRVTVNDMAPILRASWLRGVSALPNSFAHESFVDELASAAGVDPVRFRLGHMSDPRAIDLLRTTAERAGWIEHDRARQKPASGDILHGQGVAWARYVHSKWPGFGAAWAAWVADVDVDRRTGEVRVTRIVVGHDAGQEVNPAGVRHQVHGNVVQTTSRALAERVHVDPARSLVVDRDWGSYPILGFPDLPPIEVVTIPRQGEPPLGAGESASVPGTAAIANAIYDATGVRFREPPFTAEVVRAALAPLAALPAAASGGAQGAGPQLADAAAGVAPASAPVATSAPGAAAGAAWPRRAAWWARAGALGAALAGIALSLVGWRPTIAPVSGIRPSIHSQAAIERGARLAALGNCVGCHTAPGGEPLAGGLPIPTPFGVVYSTNLSPDPQTGIGNWSFSAFQRAMREGISRDGRHLYPAFPYTAFTRIDDDDLSALYAWLMTRPPVVARTPETRLAFPFGLRPLMAAWNALHLEPGERVDPVDTVRSPQWRRGAYLVDGLGHCGACHTPRDAMGAERTGTAYLSGAIVDGWEAPALSAASHAPVPWTEAAFFAYLRHGASSEHGPASGAMAAIVRGLREVPDEDIRAMAHYLASLSSGARADTGAAAAERTVAAAREQAGAIAGTSQRFFDAACGACHHDGDGPSLLGVNVPLALNSNLHSSRPDNLLRVILEGHLDPAGPTLGFMPAFGAAYDDRQLAELVGWMRRRFAPDKPPWQDLEAAAAAVRARPSGHDRRANSP